MTTAAAHDLMCCHGCGRGIPDGVPCYEVERTWVYCGFCAVPGMAGQEFPEPLMSWGFGN